MPVLLRYATRSDVGLVRSSNQDSAYAGPHLLVVADGMGGHAGGDVASAIAVHELSDLADDPDGSADPSGADAARRLHEAVHRAAGRLAERVRTEPALAGMGTTVTALMRTGDRLVLAHIGDSRAYLLRDGDLVQVTHDHTFVQHLVDAGRITPEEAEHHPQRSVLLRVLGEGGTNEALDTSVREARPGDRWLLCSDGLSGMVPDEVIRRALADSPEVDACAELLVQLALRAGGSDNVTVVVADVVDDAGRPTGHDDRAVVVGAAAAGSPHSPGSPGSPVTPGSAGDDGDPTTGTDGPAPAGGRGDDRQEGDRPPGRTHLGLRLAAVGVLLVVVAGGALAAWRWSQDQFYVGAAADGQVAVFRGLPDDVGPLRLSSVVERVGLTTDELAPVPRGAVEDGIPADDLAGARSTVRTLLEEVCPVATGPTPTPTAVPMPTTPTTPTTGPTAPATPVPAGPTTAAATPTAPATPVPAACRELG